MNEWFGHNYRPFPFELFQIQHLMVLFIFLLGSVSIYIFRKVLKTYEKMISLLMFITLFILESLYHWWLLLGKQWDLSFTLPLQLCSISLILTLLLLLTKNMFIFQLVYYLGLAGALQALITPELFVGFPHFRFIQFFITHMLIIWTALYFLFVKGYKPNLKGLWQSFFLLNGIAFIVIFINQWVGGNYMFLANKPINPSLLDYLGPHPYYIISLEILALVIFFLLFLPFRGKQNESVQQKG